MTVTIDSEPFSVQVAQEILPLAQECWAESTLYKLETCAYYGDRDFTVDPDMDRYQSVANQGLLVLVTLRDQGHLKGYVIGLTYTSMHHKKIPCGIGDTGYIEPEYRSYAAVLVGKFEQAMREQKVEIIGWPTHISGPWYEILKALGYVGDDIVMEKRIKKCALPLQ